MSQCTTKLTIRLLQTVKTQINLHICKSSLITCAFYSLWAIQRGLNESLYHTGWMYRLIWVFAGHTGLIVGFVVRWLSYRKHMSHTMRKCTFLTCAPKEDSNQPAHPCIVCIKKLSTLSYPIYTQWRFWSDCANAQSDLNLRCAHMPKGTFSDTASHTMNMQLYLLRNERLLSQAIRRNKCFYKILKAMLINT